jgi:hypothetical protein
MVVGCFWPMGKSDRGDRYASSDEPWGCQSEAETSASNGGTAFALEV